MTEWVLEATNRTAAELHADDDGRPVARWARIGHVTDVAVVLGSTQRPELLDAERVTREGIAVVRRRTGGGLVYVAPGAQVWFDFWLPPGDPLLDADVGRSFRWLGRVWHDALADLGIESVTHEGALRCGRWGRTICFAGVGPGEVTVDGRKVVGLAQRRGRWGARFQASALLDWQPELLAALVAMDPAERPTLAADLAGVAMALDVDGAELIGAVHAHLPA
jgi:lipoate-protein ligase A